MPASQAFTIQVLEHVGRISAPSDIRSTALETRKCEREDEGKGLPSSASASALAIARRDFFRLAPGTAAAAAASVMGADCLISIIQHGRNDIYFAQASEFTPGGTLVDRAVGITVGNEEASLSRKADNSNVLFGQDYYFKFGTAAPWIEPDNTDFPKTMPFTKSQQRYDALKKYRSRIQSGLERIQALVHAAGDNSGSLLLEVVADPTAADVYSLRPMGLLANAMLASENSGATNELFLARWYINELYLLINDVRNAATTPEQAKKLALIIRKATNSYLTLMNRVIIPKVGDKFEYLK
ncbi:hypothetical protein ACA910_000458 [Epithemia clementina (nom. ined.)]